MRDRLYRLFRKVALLGRTEEEMERMNREDMEANTVWILGGRVGIVHHFMEFGARIDVDEYAKYGCNVDGCDCKNRIGDRYGK